MFLHDTVFIRDYLVALHPVNKLQIVDSWNYKSGGLFSRKIISRQHLFFDATQTFRLCQPVGWLGSHHAPPSHLTGNLPMIFSFFSYLSYHRCSPPAPPGACTSPSLHHAFPCLTTRHPNHRRFGSGVFFNEIRDLVKVRFLLVGRPMTILCILHIDDLSVPWPPHCPCTVRLCSHHPWPS